MEALSEELFSHILIFSAQSVGSYVYVGPGYKLYQSNYSCIISPPTFILSCFPAAYDEHLLMNGEAGIWQHILLY